jgi:hypothetical protein
MHRGFWDAEGLKGIDRPVLFVGGTADEVSDYDKGITALYRGAVNAERWLLTYEGANHNAGAPMPPPAESWHPVASLNFVPFEHYADAVWDSVKMNNVAQHFATAFLDWQLKGEEGKAAWLDLIPRASDGVFAVDDKGAFKPEHTYWKGFAPGAATALRFEHLGKGE